MEDRKRIRRRILCLLLVICSVSITGCGQDENFESSIGIKKSVPKARVGEDIPRDKKPEDSSEEKIQKLIEGTKSPVTLKVWASTEDYEMVTKWCEDFSEQYPDVTFRFEIGEESEYTAHETVLADVEAAADVYSFMGDRFSELLNAGALSEITLHEKEIAEACGGAESGTMKAVTKNGKIYAYPATSDNGYFLYYNKAYFLPEDVESLDRMLEVASKSGKKITMQLDSGWYNLSFFLGAGFHLAVNEDGSTDCDWNGVSETGIAGADVAQSMLHLASHDAFASMQDADFLSGVQDGTVIAGVSGTWNADAIQTAWGENYGATKLPTFTCKEKQIQMSSVAGYKMFGVNPYCKNPQWAMLLAEYFTAYEQQLDRFEKRGAGPTNVEAASSDEVCKNPAIAALSMQSQYAVPDGYEGSNFWMATETFGTIIEEQNPEHVSLQKLLDNLVEEVSKPASAN